VRHNAQQILPSADIYERQRPHDHHNQWASLIGECRMLLSNAIICSDRQVSSREEEFFQRRFVPPARIVRSEPTVTIPIWSYILRFRSYMRATRGHFALSLLPNGKVLIVARLQYSGHGPQHGCMSPPRAVRCAISSKPTADRHSATGMATSPLLFCVCGNARRHFHRS